MVKRIVAALFVFASLTVAPVVQAEEPPFESPTAEFPWDREPARISPVAESEQSFQDDAICENCVFEELTMLAWPTDPTHPRNPKERTLLSDRPFLSGTSTTVGLGVTQLELGYQYIRDKSGGFIFRGHSYPQVLFRIGMFADWFELQIGYTDIDVEVEAPWGEVREFQDNSTLFLGSKIWLTQQSGLRPEMAMLPYVTVPLGSGLFVNDDVLGGFDWIYSWQVEENLRLFGSTQLDFDFEREYSAGLEQTGGVQLQLLEKLSSFVEFGGYYASGLSPMYVFQGGFLFSFSENCQFDIFARKGLSSDAFDFSTGAGLTLRF